MRPVRPTLATRLKTAPQVVAQRQFHGLVGQAVIVPYAAGRLSPGRIKAAVIIIYPVPGKVSHRGRGDSGLPGRWKGQERNVRRDRVRSEVLERFFFPSRSLHRPGPGFSLSVPGWPAGRVSNCLFEPGPGQGRGLGKALLFLGKRAGWTEKKRGPQGGSDHDFKAGRLNLESLDNLDASDRMPEAVPGNVIDQFFHVYLNSPNRRPCQKELSLA